MDFLSKEQKERLQQAKELSGDYASEQFQQNFQYQELHQKQAYVENYKEAKSQSKIRTEEDFVSIARTEKEDKKYNNAWKKNKEKYANQFKEKRKKMYQDYLANKETQLGIYSEHQDMIKLEKENWKNTEEGLQQSTYVNEMISNMTYHIARLTKLKSTMKEQPEAANFVNSSILTIENIINFCGTSFSSQDPVMLEQQSFTIMRMYGRMNINLQSAIKSLGDNHPAKEELTQLSDVYDGVNCRLFDEARKASESGETIQNWSVILQRAQGEKFVELEQNAKQTHGANSEVLILEENGRKKFFKAEEKITEKAKIQEKALEEVFEKKEDREKYAVIINQVAGIFSDEYVTFERFVHAFRKIMTENNAAKKQREVNNQLPKQQSEKDFEEIKDKMMTLVGNSEEEFENLTKVLAKYFSIQNTYELAQIAGIKEKSNMLKRNIATERLAALFKMKNVVVHSSLETVQNKATKKTTHGFAMEDTKGINMDGIRKVLMSDSKITGIEISPQAESELVLLQFLDNVTGQIDRHRNNIHYQYKIEEVEHDEHAPGNFYKKKKVKRRKLVLTHVVGIDNDMAFGDKFNIFQKNMNTFSFLAPTSTGKKYCVPTFVPPELVDAILKENIEEEIRECLAGLIEEEYIESVIERFIVLRNYILNSAGKQRAGGIPEREKDISKKYVEKLTNDPDLQKSYKTSAKNEKHKMTYEHQIVYGPSGIQTFLVKNSKNYN